MNTEIMALYIEQAQEAFDKFEGQRFEIEAMTDGEYEEWLSRTWRIVYREK